MRKSLQALALVAVLFGAAAGISYATNAVTQTATSVLQACSNATNGSLRLVADNQTDCRTNESGVSWNVVGPAGEPGPPGADGANGTNGTNGTDGTDGVSPTVRQLDPADPNCGGGGVAITDAAGHVGYVCDGAKGETGDTGAAGTPFAGTFASPNGLFSLTVADTGIVLRGPTARITLDPASLDVRADVSLAIHAGASLLLESSGQATLRASNVVVGSSTCAPALRQGDPMFVVVPPGPGGGSFPVTTVPTPSVVCIG